MYCRRRVLAPAGNIRAVHLSTLNTAMRAVRFARYPERIHGVVDSKPALDRHTERLHLHPERAAMNTLPFSKTPNEEERLKRVAINVIEDT